MNLVHNILPKVPVMLASVALLIAAALKLGKEKGAILVMLGAGGVCLITFASPMIFSVLVPRLAESARGSGAASISQIYLVIRIFTSAVWTVSLVLIAVGTFVRSAKARPPHIPLP